jgi:hypothetical protein
VYIGDWGLGIGDWGLGIGDWAQSPIPNPHPQSPIPMKNKNFNFIFIQITLNHLLKKIVYQINKNKHFNIKQAINSNTY